MVHWQRPLSSKVVILYRIFIFSFTHLCIFMPLFDFQHTNRSQRTYEMNNRVVYMNIISYISYISFIYNIIYRKNTFRTKQTLPIHRWQRTIKNNVIIMRFYTFFSPRSICMKIRRNLRNSRVGYIWKKCCNSIIFRNFALKLSSTTVHTFY